VVVEVVVVVDDGDVVVVPPAVVVVLLLVVTTLLVVVVLVVVVVVRWCPKSWVIVLKGDVVASCACTSDTYPLMSKIETNAIKPFCR
jgi:hypothetical protein